MNNRSILKISAGDPHYPVRVTERLGESAPSALETIGSVALLQRPLLGLVCSVRCPGSAILEAYETAKRVVRSEWVVVSGFHSPMEKECLRIFLRAKHPVVVCPARSLDRMRIPAEWKDAIESGKLLVLSPFVRIRRSTAQAAETRNMVVAALAERIWMPHAFPAGKTQALASSILHWGVPVCRSETVFDGI